MRRGRYLGVAAAISLSGCFLRLDPVSLQADSPAPPHSPGCSACHPYAPQDANHFTHLVYDGEVYLKRVNGLITCLDCHRTAMQATLEILFDSLYQDSQGTILSTVDSRGAFRKMPGVLIRVDTLEQHHPIPLNDKVPEAGELREWVTGLAHMNGTVDVVFDPSASDTARFHGARAEFNPKLETCSAVSCHIHDGLYRFQACSKGFPELSGGPGRITNAMKSHRDQPESPRVVIPATFHRVEHLHA